MIDINMTFNIGDADECRDDSIIEQIDSDNERDCFGTHIIKDNMREDELEDDVFAEQLKQTETQWTH